jgi:hypothetical protein
VNGGFTILIEPGPGAIPGPPCEGCPPVDPCGLVMMIAPQIYEGLDASVPTSPLIGLAGIASYLPASAVPASVEGELRIVDNIKGDCAYRLVWKLHYTDAAQGDRVGWVDAQTGELLNEASRHANKNAPTADWGIQNMPDSEDGNNTMLRNDRLAVHDMSEVSVWEVVNLRSNFNDNQIPISPSSRNWNDTDANPEVFQAFWMSDLVLGVFASALDVHFVDVRIGVHPTAIGAISFEPGTPGERANFAFGLYDGVPTVEYDIIGHELGHAVIRQFFGTSQIQSRSLHEGLADIFGTYIEAVLHPDGLNWILGYYMPLVIRDLENTARKCFTDIMHLESSHERGEALGHWFFLCVTGDAATGIPPMDIDEVMQIIMEALPNLGGNPDYPDLMAATIDIAEHAFGTCSDQFLTILRAWEQICVPTGHRLANPDEPCVFLISSTNMPCEESGVFSVCLSSNSGLDVASGRWTITGRKSAHFDSLLGMQGNSQQGGSCLHITSIPDMPFYPQAMTIYYWNSAVGNVVSQRISIVDCDGDDPTCEEHYSNAIFRQGIKTQEANIAHWSSEINKEAMPLESDLKIIAYDLTGRRLRPNWPQLFSSWDSAPQIVILTYWDKQGEFVRAEKILINHP